MTEIVQLCGYFAIVFAVSVGASYALTSIKLRRRISRPVQNSNMQVRSGTQVYRAKFLRETESGWVMSAPLSRDSYVPLRAGEKLTVCAPTADGFRQFETEILTRDAATHEMTLKRPHSMARVERRETQRVRSFLNPSVHFEGNVATLLDLSEGGARIVSSQSAKRGDRAVVEIPGSGAVPGWVLESTPGGIGNGHVVRLRFEEPLAVPSNN